MKSFFQFSPNERKGLIALILLIVAINIVTIVISNKNKSPIDIEEDKLNVAWQKIQQEQNQDGKSDVEGVADTELFYFDPNSLDSLGFVRLGLSPKTTHYLLNWRSKGKHFYKKEDLKPLYSLSETEYQRIAPFIQIKEEGKNPNYSPYEKAAALPAHINLNSIDSATLVRLNGIGAILAHKIIERRIGLGGFLNHNQLLEIYKFPDTTFAYLKEKLTINPEEIQKIKLNSCTEAQLAAHPYIGEKMAKNILLLREGLKKYQNISQLRQVPLMNEEKYRKIASYCIID